MEVISKTIIHHSKTDSFKIVPLGDIHAGVMHCDEDLIGKAIDDIHREKNTYWIGMGDYGDYVTPSDFKRWDGRILAPWMRSHEDNIGATQVDYLNDMFSPIWGKCLGLIEGNHEESIRKYGHYNSMEELLKRARKKADVPYAGVSCMLRLHFVRNGKDCTTGKGEVNDFIIHARHGEGAARTSGARALAVLRLSDVFINAHITLMGHLHGQESPDIPQRLILQNGKIKAFEALATMTGSWVKAYMQGVPACYLERWGSKPSTLGCPTIELTPQTGQMVLKKTRKTQVI